MNNAILFFYNINVSNIKKVNDNYYFKYINNDYGIYLYNRDPFDSTFIYNLNLELLNSGLIGYEIIITKDKNILFTYEEKNYILMKIPNIKNKVITYNDIKNFNFPIYDNRYRKLDKSNWGLLWENKIDFIDYQFRQMKDKFKTIENNIDYYIGIWENAISYFNNNIIETNIKYVSHRRITESTDLLEFLNPLNFIIDYKERDIGEYLKSYIINNNYYLNSFDRYITGKENIILLVSRLLFPSYFFDLYEDIIIGKKDEKEIEKVKDKGQNVIKLVRYIFDKYQNIPYINWIKKEDQSY